MGKASRSKNIHLKKLFGGKETAEQVHRQSLPGKCPCGGPPAIQIRTFMPVDEVIKNPPFAMSLAARNEGKIPCVDFKGPGGVPRKFVRVGTVYACDSHKVEAERAAARGPSCAVVEINRGPGPDKPMVQVA